MRRRLSFAALGILTLWCGVAAAQDAVQVSGVPENLSFPVPAGRNVVLTATVDGAEPRTVWLARSREAPLRYLLARVGPGRYQVNLADADVAAVLAGGGDRFQVFAELPGGQVIASIPVHYAAPPRTHGKPRVYVVADGKRRELIAGFLDDPFLEPALRARLTGQSVVFAAEGLPLREALRGETNTHWCPPDRLQRVEFEFADDAVKPAAEARVGGKTWAAEPAGRAGALTLAISPELRALWQERRDLELSCTEAGAEVHRITLRAPPARLDLPGDRAELTLTQRTSKAVPGCDGYFAIYIDDITAGQVRLSLAAADGTRLIDEKSVREGDVTPFATGAALYTVTVGKLVNYLVGDDYAVLVITPAAEELAAAEQERIGRLRDALSKADVTFVRGAEERTAAQMAASVRDVHAPTLDRFVACVAGRDPETGEEWQVRRADGERLRARTWLDGLAAQVAPPPPPPDPAAVPGRAWAKKLEKEGLPNLHEVTPALYRGAQPTAEGIRALQAMGVKTIVNLRSMHSDDDMLEGTGLAYVEIPCHAWHPEEEDVVAFLKAVGDETKGPFFVHCQHGSDRTGMMIAVYRVVVQGWTKQEAIAEMTKGGFGFDPLWAGLVSYVRDLDVEAIRKKAGLPAPKPAR